MVHRAITHAIVATMLAVLLLLAIGCTSLTRYEYSSIQMGVRATVVLYAEHEAIAEAGARAAFERIGAIDRTMSDYRSDSELNHLSDTAGSGRWIPLSSDLCAVLHLGTQISDATGGAFDVTVGPLSQLWRESRQTGLRPSPPDVDAARARTGWRHVRLNREDCLAQLDTAGMRLDLGGIAKGYGAHAAVETLRARGLERCLVDLGGDLCAGEPPPGRSGWQVRVGARQSERWSIARESVAASGDLEQSLLLDGIRYSHIIDPRSGVPLTDEVYVTVRSSDGAMADALASAISVLGADDERIRSIDPDAVVRIERTADSGVPMTGDP